MDEMNDFFLLIGQHRKRRIHIVATSQLFGCIAKQLREQSKEIKNKNLAIERKEKEKMLLEICPEKNKLITYYEWISAKNLTIGEVQRRYELFGENYIFDGYDKVFAFYLS